MKLAIQECVFGARRMWHLPAQIHFRRLLSAFMLVCLAVSSAPTEDPPHFSSVPALLADAEGVSDRFERNAMLYRILQDTDRKDVLVLLDSVKTLPETPFRSSVLEVLYVRLAQTGPEAALRNAMAVSGNLSGVSAVVRAWAHKDLTSSANRVAELSPLERASIVSVLLEIDLRDEEYEVLRDLLEPDPNSPKQELRFIDASSDTWDRAWSEALLADADEQQHRLTALAAAMAATDPVAAVERAQLLSPVGSIQFEVMNAIVKSWGTRVPAGPIEWAASQNRESASAFPVHLAMQILADHDPEQAIDLLDTLPSILRKRATGGLAKSLAGNHVDRVIGIYESLEDDFFGERGPFLASTARYIRWDDTTLNWLISLEDWRSMKASDLWSFSRFMGVIGDVYDQDRQLLVDWLADLDDPANASVVADVIVRWEAGRDAQSAWSWVADFEVEREELLADVYREWHSVDERLATNAILEMVDQKSRTEVASQAIEWLLDIGGPQDEKSAQRLFEVIASESLRSDAANRLVEYFADIGDDLNAERYRRFVDAVDP